MRTKFQPGDQVLANDNAPGDYKGRQGVVLQHGPHKAEYWVRFDGDERGPGCLDSWCLDPVSRGRE